MADYDPSSEIKNSGEINANRIISGLVELAVLPSNDGHTSFSYAPGGSTSFSTMDTAAITVENDEAVIVISTGCWSSSSTTDTWYLRHNISGETLSAERQTRVTGKANKTDGKQEAYAVVTLFTNMSGSKTVVLEVGNSDSGPSGTFYSNVGNTYIFQFKKRSS